MDRDTAREEIRRSWKQFFPADRKGKGIVCPLCGNGSGSNGDGITENPRKPGQLKCWVCGFQGDVIDLIQQQTGANYNTALQQAAADLGITIDPYRTSAAEDFNINNLELDDVKELYKVSAKAKETERRQAAQQAHKGDFTGADDKTPTTAQTGPERADIADYSEYYRTCSQRIKDPAAALYLQARGISLETAARFRLGYDPAWISPAVIKSQQAKGNNWTPPATARIILPVNNNHYVARAIDPNVTEYAKMNETGGGSSGIFNIAAVYENPVVFVTEGYFDALSIIEAGAAAVALNSTSNAGAFIKQLEIVGIPQAAIAICLDNDEAGKKAAKTLQNGFSRLGLKYINADICGAYKDPNEALTGNREAFIATVESAAAAAMAAEPAKPDLPGLLTFADAVQELETADDEYIELKSFPNFSKTAKIKKHSSVALAADTGAGKSSLALNFMNELNNQYPCIYFNLEMDRLTVLRRLIAIQSGLELDTIEGYQSDAETAQAVNTYLQAITGRKPLQIIQGAYLLEDIEEIVQASTAGREETTIVFIDHSLLVDLSGNSAGRYDRFTRVSEGLRKMALKYNIILFVLLQQNRTGKADDDERPKNSSLKESGSWENDATHICFLWFDPAAKRKKIIITKNRIGDAGEFTLNYWKKTQTYIEARDQAPATETQSAAAKKSKREKTREKLRAAYNTASITTNGQPTLRAMAEAADVTTGTIKNWIKEYGGCTIDGQQVDPAGIDTTVEYTGFIRLTPGDDNAFGNPGAEGNGQRITASF